MLRTLEGVMMRIFDLLGTTLDRPRRLPVQRKRRARQMLKTAFLYTARQLKAWWRLLLRR